MRRFVDEKKVLVFIHNGKVGGVEAQVDRERSLASERGEFLRFSNSKIANHSIQSYDLHMWIERLIEPVILDRARNRPVVVLTGARQTGKTSLVRRLFPSHNYVSLDLPSEAQQAESDPSAFLARHPAPLIVDEIQYAPGLLRHLKSDVDAHRNEGGRYILTGSQPLELMSGVAESLAGRAAILTLGGLSYAEIIAARPEVTVEEAMLRGGYPELYENPDIDVRGFYQSYVATYLERDLRSQLQVGSLRDFERFMRAAALRTSQLLNRADMARDIGISPSTAGLWLSVVERSGIITLLEPWFSNQTRSLVKSPKLHFQDSGLCAFLMGMTNLEDLHHSPLVGALWETMVFSEMHRLLAAGAGAWQLSFWRDRSREADFLLHRAGRFKLADAKWTQHPSGTGRLEKVRAEFVPAPPLAIICRCSNPHPLGNGADALPLTALTDFLS
jgi:predicted AAA+ superfamily ATPase